MNTLALTLTLGAAAAPLGGGGAESFERTAFLSSTGDDGTAELNNPALPFLQLAQAIDALNTAHPGQNVTVRLLDDVTDVNGVTMSIHGPAILSNGLTIRGHGGLRELDSTVDASAAHAEEPGAAGQPGVSIILDAVTLSVFQGQGGNGAPGVDGDESNPGGNGGDGGDGGNVTLLNGADVIVFLSDGGTGGAGGTDGGVGGGEPGANGDGGQEITP